MPVHVIADIKVTNDAWVKDYVTSVHNLVHKHGGKYLSRVGARTTPTPHPTRHSCRMARCSVS